MDELNEMFQQKKEPETRQPPTALDSISNSIFSFKKAKNMLPQSKQHDIC